MWYLIFLFQLQFKLLKPKTQSLIKQVKAQALSWNGVTTGIHPMGGVEFLFQGKEIGHIHWNGDLDILMGKKKTSQLLDTGKVIAHKFVPSVAITFPLEDGDDITYALALLRFSYLRTLKAKAIHDPVIQRFVEDESDALPPELDLRFS
jgi:hypothetical protein